MNTIGRLRNALVESSIDPALPVYIDNWPPSALSSWRGDYAQLAIECTPRDCQETRAVPGVTSFHYEAACPEIQIKTPATVGEFVKALDLAIDETFEGYKGGHFTMSADTGIWVSEWGEYENVRIVGIEVLDDRVDLVTANQDGAR